MFIGKLLCNVGCVHLELTARLRFRLMPNCMVKNHKTQLVPNDPDIWAVQTREKSNVLCLIADDQELITANFIIFEIKDYVW